MKTITVCEPYLKILENWASVSRTLNTAKQACEEIDNDLMTKGDKEKFDFCAKELETLTPALDYLHQLVRDNSWYEGK